MYIFYNFFLFQCGHHILICILHGYPTNNERFGSEITGSSFTTQRFIEENERGNSSNGHINRPFGEYIPLERTNDKELENENKR